MQAISLLRQKKLDDCVKSLNNLLACDKALPADRAVSWDERSELQDLYSCFVSRVRCCRACHIMARMFRPCNPVFPAAFTLLPSHLDHPTAKAWSEAAHVLCLAWASKGKGRRALTCCVFHVQEKHEEKQAAVAKTLGISDADAASLKEVVESGGWKLEEEAGDSNSFF